MSLTVRPLRVPLLPVHELFLSFADDPVSANQDNNRELRENRRRRSRFILPAPRHLAAVAAGALLAAVLVHYLGFIVLSWFDLGIHVHKASAVQEDRKPLPEK